MFLLTKYEYTKLKSIRLQQFADGFTPLVNTLGYETHDEIFKKELKEKALPFIIKRQKSINEFIELPISEFNTEHALKYFG